jgi:two-component system response regulator GlrR
MHTKPTGRRTAHVLVIDDDAELCELLSLRLEHHGYRVTSVTNGPAGSAAVHEGGVDAVILDLRLRDDDETAPGNGLDVLRELLTRAPELPVIILTAHGSIEAAVEAMRRGAYGFLTKPFDDHELLQKVAQAVESAGLRREVAGLRRLVGEREGHRILGASPATQRIRDIIERVGPTEATVLVLGESGTGKELAARALHAVSPRVAAPFVAVNCGALPADLLESELFGHVKGSFTGAMRDRAGLFEAASGGTLFLDEIGEAPPSVQVKLLRVLQERRFTKVGSTIEQDTDVRVVAATNRDLATAVSEGRFREDLFYRLRVVPLTMPPLRERTEDIPLLAEVFLERAAARYGLRVPRIHRSAMDLLLSHPWPGNVRELANAMEAALLLARTDGIGAEDLRALTEGPRLTPVSASAGRTQASVDAVLAPFAALYDPSAALPPLREARDAFERTYLIESLRRSGGNVTLAAKLAGRNRTDFHELLRRHNVSRQIVRDALDKENAPS